MIPSIDDRLASVVRALSDVILPSLPAEASLAREQLQLAIGHLQILCGQLDLAPAFEREEEADARALGAALLASGEGGAKTSAALDSLRSALGASAAPREARVRIHEAIATLIRAASRDASAGFRAELGRRIVELQSARALKDRKWFAPMGFDAEF